MNRYIPTGKPIIVRQARPQRRTGRRICGCILLAFLYTLTLGPVIRSLLPWGYRAVSAMMLMAPGLLCIRYAGRVLYVYGDRVVEKLPLLPAKTHYYYAVSRIRRRRGVYHISFRHGRMTVPATYENAGLLLSAMERYLKHKQNVVPISLLRILKEIQVSA